MNNRGVTVPPFLSHCAEDKDLAGLNDPLLRERSSDWWTPGPVPISPPWIAPRFELGSDPFLRTLDQPSVHIFDRVKCMNCARLMGLGFLGLLLAIGSVRCTASSSNDVATLHRDRAREFVEKQQFQEALIEYENLAKLIPQDDETQYQMALLHLRLGKAQGIDLARQAFIKTIRLNPSHLDASLQLARLYLLSEQPERARLHAEAVLALQPKNVDGHILRGESLVREGRVHDGMVSCSVS